MVISERYVVVGADKHTKKTTQAHILAGIYCKIIVNQLLLLESRYLYVVYFIESQSTPSGILVNAELLDVRCR